MTFSKIKIKESRNSRKRYDRPYKEDNRSQGSAHSWFKLYFTAITKVQHNKFLVFYFQGQLDEESPCYIYINNR